MFYRREKDGLTVFVRLKPAASTDSVSGFAEGPDGKIYLHVRIRAVPEHGKANKALLRFMARLMKIPVTTVHVAAGATSRFKQVQIKGDAEALAQLCDDKLLKT